MGAHYRKNARLWIALAGLYWNYISVLVAQTVRNLTANAGYLGLIPGLGRSPGEENSYPLQYSGLENSMDRGAWWAIQSMGSQRVGHNWATNIHTHLNRLWGSWEQGPILNSSFYVWNCTKKYQHVWPTDEKILEHSRKILRFLPCNTGWVLVTFPEMERTGSKPCLGLWR